MIASFRKCLAETRCMLKETDRHRLRRSRAKSVLSESWGQFVEDATRRELRGVEARHNSAHRPGTHQALRQAKIISRLAAQKTAQPRGYKQDAFSPANLETGRTLVQILLLSSTASMSWVNYSILSNYCPFHHPLLVCAVERLVSANRCCKGTAE